MTYIKPHTRMLAVSGIKEQKLNNPSDNNNKKTKKHDR